MRILFLTLEGALGGAERAMADIWEELRVIPEIEMRVIAFTEGPLLEHARRLGIEVSRGPSLRRVKTVGSSSFGKSSCSWVRLLGAAPGMLSEWVRACGWLRRELERERPDVVHSNSLKGHFLLWLTRTKWPVVWQVHDRLKSRPRVARALRWAARQHVCPVGISPLVQWETAGYLNVPTRCVVNGIDTKRFFPSSRKEKRAEEPLKVGLVATYARWKGHGVFLEAISLIPESVPAEYWIVGGPIYSVEGSQVSREELEQLAERLSIRPRVRFIPFCEQIEKIYGELNIVVHASVEPEPFGRTIAEALACGCAVIASDRSGAGSFLSHGQEALLVPSGDTGKLAAAIQKLVESFELRREMGNAGRKAALRYFDRRRYGEQWKRIYATASRPPLVVAMGYQEDGWHSMRLITRGLVTALESDVAVVSPRCGRRPRWFDRRLRYPRLLQCGETLLVTDHSYGDSVIHARAGFKTIYVYVHDLMFWKGRKPWNLWARRRIVEGLRLADGLITVSRQIAGEMERELGLKVAAIIPPGVDTTRFLHSAERREKGKLLHVGGVEGRKGIDRLCHLLSILPREFRVQHIGAPLRREHWRMAKEKGVQDRIEDRGAFTDQELVIAYQQASAVILASCYEGFGLPAVEARLCGTPVILSEEVPAWEVLQADKGTHRMDFNALNSGKLKPDTLAFLERLGDAVSLADRQKLGWQVMAERFQNVLGAGGKRSARKKMAG